jgi:two-component system, OmpR family, phosphate regulon sensor histidine kinase PhoR
MQSRLLNVLPPRRAWLGGLLQVSSRAVLAAVSRMHGFVAAQGRGLHGIVDEVLSAAAHEFRTPLAVVRAEAQLLLRERGKDARLANITRQVDRLTHLVQQLLEAARLPFGSAPTALDVVDLRQVVAAVVSRFERSARIHDFRLSSSRAPVWVRADRERVALALANLIDNAVRFSPEGGVVDVSLRVARREACVSVRDEGIGIPVERQRRVFDLLYRAHAGMARDYSGIGVGLAITRRIVAEHRGSVSFRSAEGNGSTFAFSLPLTTRAG